MKSLNVASFKEMLKSGNANLDNHKSEVDTLNVFPVPDGDTGTNMSMTFTNGYKEAMACPSNNICDVAKALSKGLLMGARGNSGVILSQIFRGFANSIEGKDTLKSKEIAEAFINGSKVAYKAIMKPVEGTILTVIREAVWYADHDFIDKPNMSIEEYFDRLTGYIKRSVDTTPELLPILAETNVVDSGGMGLYRIFEGFNEYLKGKPIIKKDNVTVALKYNKMKLLGACVIKKVCDYYEMLNNGNNIELEHIFINVTGNELEDHEYLNMIIEEISKSNVNVDKIAIELNNVDSINHRELFLNNLNSIRLFGLPIAISGFGGIDSRIDEIITLPVEIIKLDVGIITKANENEQASIIVKEILSLATKLGIQTIAVGVETEAQANHMIELGINYIQGRYYSDSLTLNEFSNMIEKMKGTNN